MKKLIYVMLPCFLLLSACKEETRNEKIEKIKGKEYEYAHVNDYSKADTKIVINGAGGMVSLRDNIKSANNIDLKIPFNEIKITYSKDNYFRIIGDSNIVSNITYTNENNILKFDFKSMVGGQENPLKLEIFTNQLEYIDNNSGNNIIFIGNHNNVNIQNKGILNIKLDNASFKDLLINNLGKISMSGTGKAESLYLTDFNLGEYTLDNFKSNNLSIKTRGMSKGIVNVSHLTVGDVGFLSDFTIIGNPQIKKAVANINGKLKYQ